MKEFFRAVTFLGAGDLDAIKFNVISIKRDLFIRVNLGFS